MTNRIAKQLDKLFGQNEVRELDDPRPIPDGYTCRAMPSSAMEAGAVLVEAIEKAPESKDDYTPEICAQVGGRLIHAAMKLMEAANAIKKLHEELESK